MDEVATMCGFPLMNKVFPGCEFYKENPSFRSICTVQLHGSEERGPSCQPLVRGTAISSRGVPMLAGEIVTGGHQDRVVGADTIVPAQTGPIDLDVFFVEPGRWTGPSPKFGAVATPMAQPSVRMPAMAEGNQGKVWDSVAKARTSMAAQLNVPEAAAVAATTSYAGAFQRAPVEKRIEQYGGLASEQAILRELRKEGATGVVVAVRGNIVWADAFASTDLLAHYWPKLIRSYVAEAMTTAGGNTTPDVHQAESWVGEMTGGREVVETVPGVSVAPKLQATDIR